MFSLAEAASLGACVLAAVAGLGVATTGAVAAAVAAGVSAAAEESGNFLAAGAAGVATFDGGGFLALGAGFFLGLAAFAAVVVPSRLAEARWMAAAAFDTAGWHLLGLIHV